MEVITVCIEGGLAEAGISEEQVSPVAVTYGPGLVGAFWSAWQRPSLAWAHDALIPVNHMAGHPMAAHSVELLEFPCWLALFGQRLYHTGNWPMSSAGDC